jgi:transposase
MLSSSLAQLEVAMSLKPTTIPPVAELTSQVARAAFPKGNPYLTLREAVGTIFRDEDFIELYPERGQPSLSPWRLALVTVLQFRENLSDRQAAESVRARIDWKFFLGLELTDSGFDFSVLSEFRDRLRLGGAEALLLDTLLVRCGELGLVKARGKQRTDSTRVLASIRVLNRLELVAETLHAALNELATVAPAWLQSVVPVDWYKRYSRRIEDDRLPQKETERNTYARIVGADGFYLLELLERSESATGLKDLPQVQTLRHVWARHYVWQDRSGNEEEDVQLKAKQELGPTGEGIDVYIGYVLYG